MKKISEELQQSLKALVDCFEKEEVATREEQIRLAKKLELMWDGFNNLYWDAVAHDWRVLSPAQLGLDESSHYADKQANVFRAFLESIIAALSSTVPGILCKPDDATNSDDLVTAKGGTKISELVYEHNDAPLLWIKALLTYCIQGFIAAHHETCCDEKYGTYEKDLYKNETIEEVSKTCPNCGMELFGDELALAESLQEETRNEFDPDNNDAALHAMQDEGTVCPQCQTIIDPKLVTKEVIVPRFVGKTQEPKARQIIKIYGLLNVKVPNWAADVSEMPYLRLSYETHFTNIYKHWHHLKKDHSGELGTAKQTSSGATGDANYEVWGRLNPQYRGEMPLNTPTVNKWWFRPCAFEALTDEDQIAQLKKEFPDGCQVTFVNELFAEACNESLDDHWTIAKNPLSRFATFNPLGNLLVSIQEITNEIIQLTLQTMEHGVPQTFANPQALDFKAYAGTSVRPGDIYPAKPKSGKSLADEFVTIKTSTLSGEVMPFGEKIQELGQFVSGAQPSLFGGAMESSMRTSGQYQMARNQALQRLQTPWKMINYFWKEIFGKVIPAYIKCMTTDERIVRKKNNTFVNDIIQKGSLTGKIGSVTVESSDELPLTWIQVRDVLMQLIELNNPAIFEYIAAPENLELLRRAIGLTSFSIPGEDSRTKQFQEIQQLLQEAPIVEQVIDPMTGQPIQVEKSTITPVFIADNHYVEAEICRYWLNSEEGILAKDTPGYQNVLAHLKEHLDMANQLQMNAASSAEPSGQVVSEDQQVTENA